MSGNESLTLPGSLMQKCHVLINIHLHTPLSVYSEVFLSQVHNTIVINLKDALDSPEFIGVYHMY